MDEYFGNKVAAVTGAGSGIGRGIAHKLAGVGTAVVVADVVGERADDVARELRTAGGRAVGLRTDVAQEADAAHMVETALQQFGRLDFLVNCAGNAHVGPVIDMPLAAWQSLLDVHLTGTFLCCRAAIDALVEARGRIVNLSSNYGFKGRPNGAHYSAAKAGIVALTKVLSVELAPDVNVNAVAPGPIDTPRWRAGLPDADYAAKRGKRIRDIPLGRMGTPEDIADTVSFLLGPGSRWITGQTIHVNGGEFFP